MYLRTSQDLSSSTGEMVDVMIRDMSDIGASSNVDVSTARI